MNTPPSLPSRLPGPATVPSPAGIYDYLLCGDHHSAADREAAEKALALAPEARFAALENRAFLQRAVRYIAERGVRQFIDLGSGYPTASPVHEIAGESVADQHVVYVDYDPAVARLSRALLRSANVVTVMHDVRRPWHIIDDPDVARLIDWSEPVHRKPRPGLLQRPVTRHRRPAPPLGGIRAAHRCHLPHQRGKRPAHPVTGQATQNTAMRRDDPRSAWRPGAEARRRRRARTGHLHALG